MAYIRLFTYIFLLAFVFVSCEKSEKPTKEAGAEEKSITEEPEAQPDELEDEGDEDEGNEEESTENDEPAAKGGLRMGYIYSVQVMQKMPEMAEAQKRLEAFGREMQTHIENRYMNYQKKMRELLDKRESMTDAQIEVQSEELAAMEVSIAEDRQNMQRKLQEQEMKLMEPIYAKVNKAIEAVSKRLELDFVLDVNTSGTLLWAKESLDVTKEVERALR